MIIRRKVRERFLKSKATGRGSISTVFSSIVLLCVSSIIIIIIIIIIMIKQCKRQYLYLYADDADPNTDAEI